MPPRPLLASKRVGRKKGPQKKDHIDQRPEDLKLTLIDGEVFYRDFSVFAFGRATLAGVNVQVRIIGASHIISFGTEALSFHELLACTSVVNQHPTRMEELLCAPVQHSLPGVSYEFTARMVPWEDAEPPELLALVEKVRTPTGPDCLGVIREFPPDRVWRRVTPKTVVVVTAPDDGRLVIETAHSYPNVRGLALSRSVLTRT